MTQQTTQDIHDLIQSGAVPAPEEQLDQTGKEKLAEDGTPFTVNTIQYGDDPEYGAYFQFQVDIGGKPATFRLSSNERRDAFIQALASVTANGPVTGLRLRAFPGRGGNKFVTIEPA